MRSFKTLANSHASKSSAQSPSKAFSVLCFGILMIAAFCGLLSIWGCSSDSSKDSANQSDFAPVRIGTMPTEDFLPMWAAEKDGDFDEVGVDVELLSFDSAQALSAAIAAGEVDMAMVDIPRAVKLCESGTPVALEWITLGIDASQGPFGVMAAADAPYSTLEELAEYLGNNPDITAGVGVAANTVPEYVFEMLCKERGIDPSDMAVEEVASLPERYSLMASGKLAAAALPGSLLRLGEASGMKVLAIDTEGVNISQSVMIATDAFAKDNEDKVKDVAKAWDIAAASINSDPSAYIPLLAEKANLNESIAATYPISTYPLALNGDFLCHPDSELVNLQIDWMEEKQYITKPISYDQATGNFNVG